MPLATYIAYIQPRSTRFWRFFGGGRLPSIPWTRGETTTPFARKVKEHLESQGFAVWFDAEGIAGGVDFIADTPLTR